MWRYDRKCKYMFMFSLKNLARKGLTYWGQDGNSCQFARIWNAFPIVVSSKFHWSLFSSTVNSKSVLVQVMAFCQTGQYRVQWCIHISPGPTELKLSHWGEVMHICVSKLTTIGSDNGLSPGRCQAVIWTIAGILLIEPLGTDFSENLIEIPTISSRKCIWKCHLQNGAPFCPGFNVLKQTDHCGI